MSSIFCRRLINIEQVLQFGNSIKFDLCFLAAQQSSKMHIVLSTEYMKVILFYFTRHFKTFNKSDLL